LLEKDFYRLSQTPPRNYRSLFYSLGRLPLLELNGLTDRCGLAMALFGRNFILLVEEGVALPANLQGLCECRYSGDELNMPATMKLFKAFNEFTRSQPTLCGLSRSGSHGNGLHLAGGPTSCDLFCRLARSSAYWGAAGAALTLG
jgi:hypothetical protein